MRLELGLGLLTLSLSTTAAVVGNWTLYNFSRTCMDAVNPPDDEARCAYSFSISESDDPGAPRTQCTVWAYSNKIGKPATQIEWTSYPCRERGAALAYDISNGWDPQGFITVTVVNSGAGVDAFFSYTDAELAGQNEIGSRTERAYKYGTFTPITAAHHRRRGGNLVGENKRHVGEEEAATCDPNVWVVKNLQRNARSVSQMVLFRFDLIRCDSGTHCGLNTLGANSTMIDVKYDDFYDVPCEGDAGNLRISWGYKADTDGGVMTVEDTSVRRRVFLGWDKVNGRVTINEEAEGKSEPY